ncbi:COG2426 family protein [Peptoniphilaceae bacterium SGI.131]
MTAIINFLKSYLSKELVTILVSMIPLIELKGSIPIGMGLGLNYTQAFIYSFIGSTIPAFFIVFFISYIFKILRHIKFFDKLINKITEKTMEKRQQIDKYGYLGLFIFVAIPLPGTGVWSGGLLSYLLDLNKTKSFVLIAIGNLVAGLIITLLSRGAFSIFA